MLHLLFNAFICIEIVVTRCSALTSRDSTFFALLDREESFVCSTSASFPLAGNADDWGIEYSTRISSVARAGTCLPMKVVFTLSHVTHTTHSDFVSDVCDEGNCHLDCARAVGYENLVSTGSTWADVIMSWNYNTNVLFREHTNKNIFICTYSRSYFIL